MVFVLPSLAWLASLVAILSIYLILANSLNLEFGYGGIPNFGKALAVAGGGYAVGYFPGRLAAWYLHIAPGQDYSLNSITISTQINAIFQSNIPFAIAIFSLTLVVAGAVGAGLGVLTALPAIRLREDFLAMTLLSVAEISRYIGQNYTPLAGGTVGVQVPDPFIWTGDYRFYAVTIVLLAFAIGFFLLSESISRSPMARILRAIRDNEISAEVAGKNVTLIRTKTLAIGSSMAAVAGALYAFYTSSAVAGAYNRLDWTFWVWLIIMVGGLANNRGTAIGASLIISLKWIIIFYKLDLQQFIFFDLTWLEYLLVGGMLIGFLILRPQGIIHEKATKTMAFGRYLSPSIRSFSAKRKLGHRLKSFLFA